MYFRKYSTTLHRRDIPRGLPIKQDKAR